MRLFIGLVLSITAAFAQTYFDKTSSYQLIREAEERGRERWFALDADSSHSYDMLSLSLDYRVEAVNLSPLTGTASLTFVAFETMTDIRFNAEQMTVSEVREGPNQLFFNHNNDTLFVTRPVDIGDTVTLAFDISAPSEPLYVNHGYHSDGFWAFTFSEPYGARRWFPCFDQPFDKLNEVTIAVNMPESWSLAANGELISTTFPEPGRRREVYYHDRPISTYLVVITAGDFSRRIFTEDGVLYRYFAFPEDSVHAAYDWERTPQMTALFEDYFGEYPFDEYGMAEAPILNGWGAMEHQTFTSYGWRLIDSLRTFEGVVAHELAHQWFGDHLSPIDFRDMWLNEGFATYSAALWLEHLHGDSALALDMQAQANAYFAEDEIQRYAAYDPPPDYLFGSVIYLKGSWILHMLRKQLLGDSLFFAGLRQYVSDFGGGNVTTLDFQNAMSDAYGHDLTWFFNQWVFEAGHPELIIDIVMHTPNEDSFQIIVQQEQVNSTVFRFPLLINMITDSDTFLIQSWFESVNQINTHGINGLQSATLAPNQPLLYELAGLSVPPGHPKLPNVFDLHAIYPNPFNATTTISFDLSATGLVKMDLFDIEGRFVKSIANQNYPAGTHEIKFTASADMSSGIYFVRAVSMATEKVSKLVLLK